MTEQELLQENEKLNGRLNKAIEVFNNQKSEIVKLNETIESLNATIEKNKKEIAELKVKSSKVDENNEIFMKQEEEIASLKKTISEQEDGLKEDARKMDQLNDMLDDETEKCKQQDAFIKKITAGITNLYNQVSPQ